MKRRERRTRRKVAIVLSTDMACFREVLRGIYSYAFRAGNWHIDLASTTDDYIAFLKTTRPDGLLLGSVTSHSERVEALDIVQHAVSAIGQHSPTDVRRIPEVESDDEAVGALAALYFAEKGYTNFAFLGAEAGWSAARWRGFEGAVKQVGGHLDFKMVDGGPPPLGRGWVRTHYDDDVVQWIRMLPKPVAILACNDIRGRELCELCTEVGLKVPDEIAILGVDNDDLECELSHPPLSSVAIPWRQAGHQAAALLDDLLREKPVQPIRYYVAPTGVVERQSTNTLAIVDKEVAAALQYIRDHAHQPIEVNDVVKEVATARRSLEKRFHAILGRSPLAEIRRVRIEHAKKLLQTTDMNINEIAEATGFASSAWFSKTFHSMTRESPLNFRRRIRDAR